MKRCSKSERQSDSFDLLLNHIPFFLRTEFYGSVALIIGLIIYLMDSIDMLTQWTIMLLFISGVTLRLLAYYRKWHLPKI